jgi:hypothetical protein
VAAVAGSFRRAFVRDWAKNKNKKTKGEHAMNMYLTVRRYDGCTNPREAARQVREGFIPIISQIPGFIEYYWVDVGGGVMVSTSVFESKAAAEESNRKAADWVGKNLKPLLPNPPQISAGEVVAHKAK